MIILLKNSLKSCWMSRIYYISFVIIRFIFDIFSMFRLAKKIKISASYLNDIEKNKRPAPKLNIIKKILMFPINILKK